MDVPPGLPAVEAGHRSGAAARRHRGLEREPAAATRTSEDMLRAKFAENGTTDVEVAIRLSERIGLTCCILQVKQIFDHIENKST
jgi:hypothetical protein